MAINSVDPNIVLAQALSAGGGGRRYLPDYGANGMLGAGIASIGENLGRGIENASNAKLQATIHAATMQAQRDMQADAIAAQKAMHSETIEAGNMRSGMEAALALMQLDQRRAEMGMDVWSKLYPQVMQMKLGVLNSLASADANRARADFETGIDTQLNEYGKLQGIYNQFLTETGLDKGTEEFVNKVKGTTLFGGSPDAFLASKLKTAFDRAELLAKNGELPVDPKTGKVEMHKAFQRTLLDTSDSILMSGDPRLQSLLGERYDIAGAMRPMMAQLATDYGTAGRGIDLANEVLKLQNKKKTFVPPTSEKYRTEIDAVINSMDTAVKNMAQGVRQNPTDINQLPYLKKFLEDPKTPQNIKDFFKQQAAPPAPNPGAGATDDFGSTGADFSDGSFGSAGGDFSVNEEALKSFPKLYSEPATAPTGVEQLMKFNEGAIQGYQQRAAPATQPQSSAYSPELLNVLRNMGVYDNMGVA